MLDRVYSCSNPVQAITHEFGDSKKMRHMTYHTSRFYDELHP